VFVKPSDPPLNIKGAPGNLRPFFIAVSAPSDPIMASMPRLKALLQKRFGAYVFNSMQFKGMHVRLQN
jgi:hypothetical protein